MSFSDLLRGAAALLAPPHCPGCDLPCQGLRPAFCAACAPLIEPAPASLSPPRPVAARCVYGGPLADAVRRIKYAGRHDMVGPLAALLRETAPAYFGRVDCVVPIPLHARRLQQRGYNQVGLLCRPLARALGVPVVRDLLLRVRPTPPQAGLPAEARLPNIRGAFAVSNRGKSRSPARVLLVDDVRTSGATLTEAALCLRRSGAVADVFCLALASVV